MGTKPNLKMLEFGKRCKSIIDKHESATKPVKIQTQGCEVCGSYLVKTDWAPTCNECGSVHIDNHYLKFENDDCTKPKKMLYSREGHLFGKITKRHTIALDNKNKTRLKYLFEKTINIYNEIKGDRKNFLNYEFILMKLFEYMNLPYTGFKKLKSQITIEDHNKFWNIIVERL